MLRYQDFRPSKRIAPTVAVGRDGHVAFVDDAAGVFNISLISPGGSPTRLAADAELSVRRVAWGPDARRLVFAADRGGTELVSLHAVDVNTSVVSALTDAPEAEHRLGEQPVSPDGQALAYVANDRDRTVQDVIVRDFHTGGTRRIYEGTGLTHAGYWSPDGRHLTVADWVEPHANHTLHVVDLDSGDVRTLTDDERAVYWMGPWTPDGTGFFVVSNRGRDTAGLALMDSATGELDWIDTPEWEVEQVQISADGTTLVWLVNIRGVSEIRARHIPTGADVKYASIPTGVVNALAVSADASAIYAVMSTPSDPTGVARLTQSNFEWLTDVRPSQLVTAGVPELVSVVSPAGDPFEAWLYRPNGITGPVGVVISIHGGPTWQERPTYMYAGFYQYLLSRGLAVIAPNIHGSTGYGSDFSQRIYRDWGGVDLDDLAALHAYLCAQDWVDPDRIGLYGASYGGFLVLSCVTRLPELNWAAAVDENGISNLVTLTEASPPTWRKHVLTIIGDPEADREFLLSRSPLTYADKARTPLLVIQGANDPRVPMRESDQIVEALRSHAVDVVYEVVADEGHHFSKAETDIRLQALAADFLADRLC